MSFAQTHDPAGSVAVIGMSGRFPRANNIEEFWQNLCNGVECISFFSDEELRSAGVDPALLSLPNYVKAGGVLEGVDMFDALFFGYSAKDAEIMDPQQRLFLECAWESLEYAGYDPDNYPGLIGVFGGTSLSSYLFHLYGSPDRLASVDHFQLMVGNDKDHLTTHVSYKLNLRGPSVDIQTACSTSLVAICVACQSLLSYQSDIALAGGVTVSVPQGVGYLYQPGGIASPDGHCRAFDASAQGTMLGNGVGIVVLKRLSEAIADGDHIHAVIRGSAMNNDGSLKVGYTAPSVEGQAQVIAMAQALAGVEPESITYIEAHGTGTPLGDPIEIAALTQAFRARTNKKGFCAIGSVKTNVGHLDSAAGVAGFIKTVLAIERGLIPPSLHFTEPNPVIDFVNSPFRVNARLSEWRTDGRPRCAGVSSFGIGGTNAHVVLEQAPAPEPSVALRSCHLLVLSARSGTALERATDNLAAHLTQHSELNVADVAFTSQVGRKAWTHRRMLLCAGADLASVATLLERRDPQRVITAVQETKDRPVAFLFPGQGTQYVDMARKVYETEPEFRREFDLCAEALRRHLETDLRGLIYPPPAMHGDATRRLQETAVTQPALFAIEYALAKLWMSWGIYPRAMIGHSIGEYVSACLAGVFSLEDALAVVAERARLMARMPAGAMLAVPLSELDVQPLIGDSISLAAVNAPSLCVLSGPEAEIEQLASRLGETGLPCRRLHTSHAFHSALMEPAVWPFVSRVQCVRLSPPEIPFLSNVTGTWITPEAATNPTHWGRHLRQTVRFSEGLQELMRDPDWVLLEVGPGNTLSTLAKQHAKSLDQAVIHSLPGAQDRQPEMECLLTALGRVWLNGVPVDWRGFHAHERLHRVALPAYPFERQRYWIGGPSAPAVSPHVVSPLGRREISDWFYLPAWKPAPPSLGPGAEHAPPHWLVLRDDSNFCSRLVHRLEQEGHTVTALAPGTSFAKLGEHSYVIRPSEAGDYEAVLKDLAAGKRTPEKILHLWTLPSAPTHARHVALWEHYKETTFYSLLSLAQALAKGGGSGQVDLEVVSTELCAVTGEELLCPAKAGVLGPCKVIPQEFSNLRCRSIDLAAPLDDRVLDQLINELTREPFSTAVAYRKGRRWVQTFEPVKLAPSNSPGRGRQKGVYLITGGLGEIGLTLAEYLARTVQARLVLTGRSAFPAREEWEGWLRRKADDPISRKIRRLVQLEERGAEVLVVSADAADREQMRRALEQAHARFGDLHGLIHGAGNTSADALVAVAQADRDSCERHFGPKVQGLMVLEELLAGKELDFVLLLSSLSSVLGGLGFVAYSTANIFMDAFAREQNRRGPVPWISVNWDAWQFSEPSVAPEAILPQEGAEAFERILDRAPQQIVVSTHDLQARFAQWVELESVRGAQAAKPAAEHHPRPSLTSQYVAPQTATEQTLAEIWQDLLGVAPIGSYDNFFELGGHSLLAIQLVSRIRTRFEVEVPVQRLFETPTISALAEAIDEDQAAREEGDPRLAEALDFVENLSDEEVRALLEPGGISAKEQISGA